VSSEHNGLEAMGGIALLPLHRVCCAPLSLARSSHSPLQCTPSHPCGCSPSSVSIWSARGQSVSCTPLPHRHTRSGDRAALTCLLANLLAVGFLCRRWGGQRDTDLMYITRSCTVWSCTV
jgi:hypothetical protein